MGVIVSYLRDIYVENFFGPVYNAGILKGKAVSMRTVQKAIDDIIAAAVTGKVLPCDRLAALLAEFLHLSLTAEQLKDDMKYPEPPAVPLEELRSTVRRRYPDLGTCEPARVKRETRNAADDLAALTGVLMILKWYYEKTGRRNGNYRLKLALESGLARSAADLLAHCIDRGFAAS